jgi:methyl-accepting chemotaxis protein
MSLSRLALRTRIYAGFSLLILLGLALTAFGGWQLSSIQDGVRRMSKLSDGMVRVSQIGRALETIHRASLAYLATGNEEQLRNASDAAAKATELLQVAAQATTSPERRRAYNDLQTSLNEFQRKRETLVQSTQTINADRSKLSAGGDQLSSATAKLVEAARASGDASLIRAASEIEPAVLLVRVAHWRFLTTHEPSGPATFKSSASRASVAIAALEQAELANAIRPLVAATKTALSDYITAFDSVSTQMLKRDELFEKHLAPLLVDMQTTAANAQSSLSHDFEQMRDANDGVIDTTITLQEVAAGLVLVIGALMAFLIARVIIGPVAAMTEAMERLATGDIRVEVPSREHSDEIGAMARAVEVFKQNAVERRRLEDEKAQNEARSVQERYGALTRLADTFSGSVGGIIDTVSATATELEAAATTLTRTAETTHDLAGAVAGASEDASTNVQSVATAAEELFASVNEIGRQVQQSTTIAAQAVKQAEATDARISDLSQAASRIGDVVQLITAIAEQTNLLALNATIEAARAGESGRGFAVVAQEVKTLAAQTQKATGDIGAQITGMQAATQQSVGAIKEIGTTISRISEIASIIAAAVEQQSATTQEISRSINRASQSTGQVATKIGEVNRGASETGSASSQVLTSARSLANEGNRLKVEVEKFLATVRAG